MVLFFSCLFASNTVAKQPPILLAYRWVQGNSPNQLVLVAFGQGHTFQKSVDAQANQDS